MQQCHGVVYDVSVGRTLTDILLPNADGWIDSLMCSEQVARTARAKAYRQVSLVTSHMNDGVRLTSPLNSICCAMYSMPFLYCDLVLSSPTG